MDNSGMTIDRRALLRDATFLFGAAAPAGVASARLAVPDRLGAGLAGSFAGFAMAELKREYPVQAGLSRLGVDDPLSPRINHPIFYGSFDWSTATLNCWMLARLARLYPSLAQTAGIRAYFDHVLSAEKVATEIAFFAKPDRQGFSRPVGWGHVMMLDAEFARQKTAQAANWHRLLTPLVDDLKRRMVGFLPKLANAGRSGTLPLGLSLMACAAQTTGDAAFLSTLRHHAERWYATMVIAPNATVGGEESVPAELATADLMRRVLPKQEFTAWFQRFAPTIEQRQPAILFEPCALQDRSDWRITLATDLMNLHRSWLLGNLGRASEGRRAQVLLAAAHAHYMAGIRHLDETDYGRRSLPARAVLALQQV
ncbi:DUF2891 family protein [Sphingomonas nostoxanthinifaciens]|uniref:DUF2891 family protein n=1 Tax=Sphingomonas nostoxanthinifaciens TaxID=2872652 RepID=UPI001CC21C34|nr:DUF2891 family protein [Sphingomonas nostoxanthinifaciens]